MAKTLAISVGYGSPDTFGGKCIQLVRLGVPNCPLSRSQDFAEQVKATISVLTDSFQCVKQDRGNHVHEQFVVVWWIVHASKRVGYWHGFHHEFVPGIARNGW